MGRLVAFGCSITYGHGLSDCLVPGNGPGLNTSKLAWPELVADKLGIKCVNQAKCGSSNQRILHSILEFDFEPGDIAAILWSFKGRSMVMMDDAQPRDILPSHNPASEMDFINAYYSVHSDTDMSYQTIRSMSHASLYLKSRNIQVASIYHSIVLNHSPFPASMRSSLEFIGRKWWVDYASDGTHPGPKSQEILANLILPLLQK